MPFCRVAVCVFGVSCALLGSFPAFAQSQRGLTLSQALQRALAANPRLTAAEREIGVATGRRIQAGAIPNPEISVEVENVFGTGVYRGTNAAETTLQISQVVEFPGKRGARIASASAEVDSARWQRQAERLEVLSETAVAFVNVISAQRRVKIFDDIIASLDRLTPLLQRRVEAGASSPADIARAQVAADLIRVDRERTKTALATARRELAALMGIINPDFGQAVGDFGRIGSPPPFATVLHALDNHPQLIRWTAVGAHRKAELLSARLKPLPDVRLGVGYKHFNETRDQRDDAWSFRQHPPVGSKSRRDPFRTRDAGRRPQPSGRSTDPRSPCCWGGPTKRFRARCGNLNFCNLPSSRTPAEQLRPSKAATRRAASRCSNTWTRSALLRRRCNANRKPWSPFIPPSPPSSG